MNNFKLFETVKDDLTNKIHFKINNLIQQLTDHNQQVTIISIIGECSSGKSLVQQALMYSLIGDKIQNEINENKDLDEERYNDHIQIEGVLIDGFNLNNNQKKILILDCNFVKQQNQEIDWLQKRICTDISDLSQITLYISIDVTLQDINTQFLLDNTHCNLQRQNMCLLINKQTKSDIEQLQKLQDYQILKSQFEQIIFIKQSQQKNLPKDSKIFGVLNDYIKNKLSSCEQQQTLNQIQEHLAKFECQINQVFSQKTKLIQDQVSIQNLKQDSAVKNELNSHEHNKSYDITKKYEFEKNDYQIEESNNSFLNKGVYKNKINEQKQENSINEIISINSQTTRFNLIRTEKIKKEDQDYFYKIELNQEAIEKLQKINSNKKCVAINFFGLKDCGKSEISKQFLNILDSSIVKEIQKINQKNSQKVRDIGGTCILHESNDIVYLIIDMEELFIDCSVSNNINQFIQQLISNLAMQSIIDQSCNYSFYLKSSIRFIQKEKDSIKYFKLFQDSISRKKSKNSYLLVNKLNEQEKQSLSSKNGFQIKEIKDNFKNQFFIRFEDFEDSQQSKEQINISKDQLFEDVVDIVNHVNNEIKNSSTYHNSWENFIHNLQQNIEYFNQSQINKSKQIDDLQQLHLRQKLIRTYFAHYPNKFLFQQLLINDLNQIYNINFSQTRNENFYIPNFLYTIPPFIAYQMKNKIPFTLMVVAALTIKSISCVSQIYTNSKLKSQQQQFIDSLGQNHFETNDSNIEQVYYNYLKLKNDSLNHINNEFVNEKTKMRLCVLIVMSIIGNDIEKQKKTELKEQEYKALVDLVSELEVFTFNFNFDYFSIGKQLYEVTQIIQSQKKITSEEIKKIIINIQSQEINGNFLKEQNGLRTKKYCSYKNLQKLLCENNISPDIIKEYLPECIKNLNSQQNMDLWSTFICLQLLQPSFILNSIYLAKLNQELEKEGVLFINYLNDYKHLFNVQYLDYITK